MLEEPELSTSTQTPFSPTNQIEERSTEVVFTNRVELDPIEESVLKLEYDINQTIKNNNDKLLEEKQHNQIQLSSDKTTPVILEDIEAELIPTFTNQDEVLPESKNDIDMIITSTLKPEPNFKKMLYALSSPTIYPVFTEKIPFTTEIGITTIIVNEPVTYSLENNNMKQTYPDYEKMDHNKLVLTSIPNQMVIETSF